MIFWKTEEKYFCAEGWTGQIRLKLLTEIGVLAQRFSASGLALQSSVLLPWRNETGFSVRFSLYFSTR